MKEIEIRIEKNRDYDKFWDEYIDCNNELKEEYRHGKINFIVKFNKSEDVDEQLLFNYYLIANKYKDVAEFILYVYLDENREENNPALFKLSHYGFLQQSNSRIVYSNGKIENFLKKTIRGVKRQVPVVCINFDSLHFLRTGIDEEKWKRIKEGNIINIETGDGQLENVIYKQCWRLLFENIETGNTYLSKLRKELYECDEFFELIKGIPILSLLIFAMSDYAFREDAVGKYKSEIKNITGQSIVNLKNEDFLYELQNIQKREYFEVNRMTAKAAYDNKTIWSSYKNKKIHPFVIKEMYEAIIIAEGIIQLLENIVFHAGKQGNDGEGLLSIYVRNFENDKKIFEKKYPKYIEYCNRERINSKYLVEVIIADLSGTNIPQKFMVNNLQFINDNKNEIDKRIKELGGNESIPEEISLSSFFRPTTEESIFWSAFFSFPDKVINHYGLQIFDSIISTKGGLVEVESGSSMYSSISGSAHVHMNHGSRYTIVCPFNATSSQDTNIYDSMFGYNYNINNDINPLTIHSVNGIGIKYSPTLEGKKKYIEEILKRIKEKDTMLLKFEMSTFESTECTIKALLLHIFQDKEKDVGKKFYIALLGCKTHQIINIVRTISLFYNKQGKNIKMKNVQIYIRGEKVGEEILFYGEKLEDVKNNLAKCACIRGIMFDNLQAINKVLERSGGRKYE